MSAAAIGVVGLMLCSSSSAAAMFMMGGDEEPKVGPTLAPAAPVPPPPPTPVLRDTPETMRCASTVHGGEAIGTGHGRGRLDSVQAWSAQNNTVGEWYQIDNGVVGKITGVAIKGRKDCCDQWVKTFKVKSKGDDGVWKDVDSGKVYTGNTDPNTQVNVTFDTPVEARYIRFYPQLGITTCL